MFLFSLCQFIMMVLPVLINVAFITLLERKVLGLTQARKGPNKTSFMGILQPFSDAVKLFCKELVFPSKSNFTAFFCSPAFLMALMLLFWLTVPSSMNFFPMKFSFVLFMAILSLNVYPLFFSGWSSNSKYATIGAIRGVSQAISYEISLALMVFIYCSLPQSLALIDIPMILGTSVASFAPVITLWVVSCVAETNRTPFDFSEGESELVSGFNVEYGAVLFALLFMSEYGMILFLSILTAVLITGNHFNKAIVIFTMVMLSYFWVWLRATYPRFRYDKLMILGWKVILPSVIILLLFYFSLNLI